uniref:Uncharacterized protein n=1 Tax=Arundo donax TaxID=35708 RepID=A0A0A9EE81_ARUDO
MHILHLIIHSGLVCYLIKVTVLILVTVKCLSSYNIWRTLILRRVKCNYAC